MEQISGQKLFVYLFGLIVFLGAISLMKGGLYINRHEGDMLHLSEIVLRMAQGEWPHLDFVTPLGIAAFMPISGLMQAGFGLGMAMLLSQIIVALVFLPAIWWVARTRFAPPVSLAFGAASLVMVLALVHGEAAPDVSLSMHYNRWAWAAAFLAVPIAMLPARDTSVGWPDGVILGAAMGFLILCKVTFAVALTPGLIAALVLRRAWGTIGLGLVTVLICVAIPTVLAGIDFWQAYIADLLQVSSSGIRPRAGATWMALLMSPAFIVANLVLVASFLVLRKGDRPQDGLVLLLLAPGFIYITYQNYGNDPKWLALLAALVFTLGSSTAHRILALTAAILIAPSFYNMAVSPLRHAWLGEAQYVAMFEAPGLSDVHTPIHRVNRVQERGTVTFEDPQFAALNEFADKEPDIVFEGITYPSCKQELGLLGIMRDVASDLRAAGLGDEARIFTTDTFGSIWMFGGFAPLQGGAPWSYGALSGFENAGYVLVPSCPITPSVFKALTSGIDAQEDVTLTELRRTELYTIYEISRATQ